MVWLQAMKACLRALDEFMEKLAIPQTVEANQKVVDFFFPSSIILILKE
jgi:hypothetical protein